MTSRFTNRSRVGAGDQLDAVLTASRRRATPRPLATRFTGGTFEVSIQQKTSAIADQRLTPADGTADHRSGMLTASYAPVDISEVRIVPNEQRLVLASLDRAQARVVPTRSGQRQQLSFGWEGRKPLDTE